jgi:hypothetical protein
MKKYQIFKKKMFESMEKYETRLNDECRKGYRLISMTYDYTTGICVLLEKVN